MSHSGKEDHPISREAMLPFKLEKPINYDPLKPLQFKRVFAWRQ